MTIEFELRMNRWELKGVPARFLADEISLLDTALLPSLQGVGSRALGDLYLLALSVHHGTRFVTLDARINPDLVPSGRAAYQVVS